MAGALPDHPRIGVACHCSAITPLWQADARPKRSVRPDGRPEAGDGRNRRLGGMRAGVRGAELLLEKCPQNGAATTRLSGGGGY